MCKEFFHLHCHDQYSLLDGLATIDDMIKRLEALGQRGYAQTNHGNMYGTLEFYRAMKKANMLPIIGMEAYVVKWGNTIAERGSENRENNHMLLLAENQKGYQNLVELSSHAGTAGFYYKPRTDWDAMARYSEGIICTSGCMAAPINQAVQNNNITLAKKMIEWHIDVYGLDRFFIELQVHPGIPELNPVNQKLIELAREYGLKCILTNDSHYANAKDADPHAIMLCVQTNKNIHDPNRFKFTDNDYYVKSADEMRRIVSPFLGDDDIDKMFQTTIEIAERCGNVNPEGDLKPKIPAITVLSPFNNADDYLAHLVRDGLTKIYGYQWGEDYNVVARMQEELSVIKETGFAAYYLIIHDICKFAESKGISWNTRGSAAGSLVFYAIGVSFVDPIENKLLFSRFLNTFRVSIPDCDLDFPDSQRKDIIQYIIEKYGEDRVAQVITFGTMKARMAIRDVGRALGFPQDEVDRIAKSIKNTPGKPINLTNSMDEHSEYYSDEFATLYRTDKTTKAIVDYALSLENKSRHTGVHAAAVLITPTALTNYVPIIRGGNTAHTKHIAQWSYPDCESIGLLKVDCLGLATQTIIDEACKLINARHGTSLTYHNIPYNDSSSYKLLCDTNLIGVFQVENQGLRKAIGKLQPKRFSQVADIISLYRPGPIQYIQQYIEQTHTHGIIEYKHPLLESIISDTAGVCVYQEQVIKILVQLAGFTEVEADGLRKAISKKDVAKIDKGREKFVSGCAKQNKIDAATANSIYDDIEKFALYGFNRAHAASYARITLITAWLKANYTLEYLTACLIVEGWDEAKRVKYINDAKKNDIKILPPKIGLSTIGFHIDNDAIRFGYENIKTVGDKAAKKLSKIKDLNGLVALKLNRTVIEALTSAGAFDDYNFAPKGLLLANLDIFIEYLHTLNKINNTGQRALTHPDIELKVTKSVKLSKYEREYLGVWLQHHPLGKNTKYNEVVNQKDSALIDSTTIPEKDDKEMVMFVGVVQSIREVVTRGGKKMAFVTLSDDNGLFNAVIFPKAYELLHLEENQVYHVTGAIQHGEEETVILVNKMQRIQGWE